MEIRENTFEALEALNDRLTKFDYNRESKKKRESLYKTLSGVDVLLLGLSRFEDVTDERNDHLSFEFQNCDFETFTINYGYENNGITITGDIDCFDEDFSGCQGVFFDFDEAIAHMLKIDDKLRRLHERECN